MIAASLRLSLALAAPAMLLSGCAVPPAESGNRWFGAGADLQREHTLQAMWRGRPYHTLLEAYGPAPLAMGMPGQTALKTSIMVYGVLDAATRCIDAFTVVQLRDSKELIVSDYFCR